MNKGGIIEHTAHECDFSAPTCTTSGKCNICGAAGENATGHNYVDGVCSTCGANKPAEGAVAELLATFELGTTSTNSTSSVAKYEETDGDYTLSITGADKMYLTNTINDTTNVGIKFGSSSAKGYGTINVAANVTKVVIHVYKYNGSGDGNTITVAGTSYNISTSVSTIEIERPEGDGEWTISFSANVNKNRYFFDTIEFYGFAQ